METKMINNTLPTRDGFFGNYGGQYIEEYLKNEFNKIADEFLRLKDDPIFNKELNDLLKYFVGRPSPVYFAKNIY